METRLASWFGDTHDGRVADEILRKCVHCGFCTATCPTYQLLGDENDGPRGRIYLMKEIMEGAPATRDAMEHLDRCLTCRNCESTCPSGVRYGHLVDIGRRLVEERVPRPWRERMSRLALREMVTRRWIFEPAMRLARRFRPMLPEAIRKMTSLPARQFNLKDRGEIAPGKKADLVVFDPGEVGDAATYEQPHQLSRGIEALVVNGEVVLAGGRPTGARPGRFLD